MATLKSQVIVFCAGDWPLVIRLSSASVEWTKEQPLKATARKGKDNAKQAGIPLMERGVSQKGALFSWQSSSAGKKNNTNDKTELRSVPLG